MDFLKVLKKIHIYIYFFYIYMNMAKQSLPTSFIATIYVIGINNTLVLIFVDFRWFWLILIDIGCSVLVDLGWSGESLVDVGWALLMLVTFDHIDHLDHLYHINQLDHIDKLDHLYKLFSLDKSRILIFIPKTMSPDLDIP